MDIRDTRLSIIEIQENLRELYKAGWEIALVIPDGIYGTHTRSAVKAFQALVDLPASGIVNFPTWTLLVYHANNARAERSAPRAIHPFNRPLAGGSAQRGERFDLVLLVQLMLNETQAYSEPLELTGHLDEATEEALIDFQEKNGIEPSGRIDRATWDALAAAYDKYLPQNAEY